MATDYLPADVMDRAGWFVHDRFGMFIHWGLYAIPSLGEWALKTHGSRLGTVDWNSTTTDVSLALPFHEPDPLDTVIELELSG